MSIILEFIPYDISNIMDISNSVMRLPDIIYNVFENINIFYTYLGISTLILCYLTNVIIKLMNYDLTDYTANISVCQQKKEDNMALMPKELYYQSIIEVLEKNTEIANKMMKNIDYWILLRVVMKNPMKMKRTKYELHSNNVGNNVGNSGKRVFNTQDMYMIIKLRFNEYEFMNGKVKFNMGNTIVRCMNHLNIISPEEYKTKDFIVVAISTKPITNYKNSNEFYDGLINNNYELYNFKDVKIKINGKDDKMYYVGYIMMLPIHEIYDIFMDVYNTTLFETVKYAIDDDNYESWNGVSINELKF